jgi:cystathionine beta-lyase
VVVYYHDGNRRLLGSLLAEHAPAVGYALPEATYLAWLDCRSLDLGPGVSPAALLRERAGVTVTDGALCGAGYEGFVRLVFAMPRPLLREATLRIADALAAP